MPLTELEKALGRIAPERLLAESEALLRAMPPRHDLCASSDEVHAWLGRLRAFFNAWDLVQSVRVPSLVDHLRSANPDKSMSGLQSLLDLLHQARADLQLKTNVSPSAVIEHGQVFDYSNEIRKITEMASQDLLFVDPYLDADFAQRYLPSVKQGVSVRLLTREKLSSLLPAVRLFNGQQRTNVQVRTASNFHDRFVFVDCENCYQSGASFKDGGKTAPTVLSQIRDGAAELRRLYEALWVNGQEQL